jgi:hypothetical protein
VPFSAIYRQFSNLKKSLKTFSTSIQSFQTTFLSISTLIAEFIMKLQSLPLFAKRSQYFLSSSITFSFSLRPAQTSSTPLAFIFEPFN